MAKITPVQDGYGSVVDEAVFERLAKRWTAQPKAFQKEDILAAHKKHNGGNAYVKESLQAQGVEITPEVEKNIQVVGDIWNKGIVPPNFDYAKSRMECG